MSCCMKISRRSLFCGSLSRALTVWLFHRLKWRSGGWRCGCVEGSYSKLSLNDQDCLPCVTALPVPQTPNPGRLWAPPGLPVESSRATAKNPNLLYRFAGTFQQQIEEECTRLVETEWSMSAWKKFFQPYHDWRIGRVPCSLGWGRLGRGSHGRTRIASRKQSELRGVCRRRAIHHGPGLLSGPAPVCGSALELCCFHHFTLRLQNAALCALLGLVSRGARQSSIFLVPHFHGNNNEGSQHFKVWKGFRPSYAFSLGFLICDSSRH